MPEKRLYHDVYPEVFALARELRKEMTPAEKKLWGELRQKQLNGYRFRRQHPIGRYIVDFYCYSANLVIEIDGMKHNSPIQKKYDDERTCELEEIGLMVLRFTNKEVLKDLDQVINKIIFHLPSTKNEEK